MSLETPATLIDAYGETRSGVRRDDNHRQAKPDRNIELARGEAALAASFGTHFDEGEPEDSRAESTKHRKLKKIQKTPSQ